MPARLAFTAEGDSIRPSSSLKLLPASYGEELSGSVTDPALLPSSSSRNARLRADEELIHIMTKAVNELGLEWSPLRSHLAAGWTSIFSWGAIKPSANAHPPSSPKFIWAHDIVAHPPTPLASVLLLQLLSHLLTALKKKDMSTCLLWMSLWPHISARPPLLNGRRGRAIRPSRIESHLHSLDAPTRRLDKWLQCWTLWLCSRSSRPRCSPVRKPVWMQLHPRTWGARQTLLYVPPKPLPGHRAFDVQPGSIRAPPLAHDDGDERGGQSSLPRRSGVRQPVWTNCGGLCWMLHGGSEVVLSDATLPP